MRRVLGLDLQAVMEKTNSVETLDDMLVKGAFFTTHSVALYALFAERGIRLWD